MDVKELVQIVEDMVVQHDYPGYDVRSLQLGLPEAVTGAPPKVFHAALSEGNALVRLAALRWFWERPGIAKRYLDSISDRLEDPDEWVRREAARLIGRFDSLEEKIVMRLSACLEDPDREVRKAAAKSIGQIGCTAEAVLARLRKAAEDPDTEVKWKAQKALRKLGDYSS